MAAGGEPAALRPMAAIMAGRRRRVGRMRVPPERWDRGRISGLERMLWTAVPGCYAETEAAVQITRKAAPDWRHPLSASWP
ncbi:MAG: hypothetical protein ACK56F_00700, partial [bacterium]